MYVFLSGARNETEKLLLESLHALNLPCYHHTLGGLLSQSNHTALEVATRMYLRPGEWREGLSMTIRELLVSSTS